MSELKHVVIVGGGTAGWITAGVLAADHRAFADDGLQITLIESANIPSIGVGEGTWPTLRDTLQRIGISEIEFLRTCNASFKQGSRFDGWLNGGANDSYYHPFDAPPSEDDVDAVSLWRASGDLPFADAVSSQSALCRNGRAPKQVQTPQYAAVANYAYHLDASALAALLTEHCVRRLGVKLMRDDVVDTSLCADGSVDFLVTRENGTVGGDLFVDCTGQQALLINKVMGAKVTDVSDVLFNDRAWATRVSHTDPQAEIASQTTATAMSAGWIWDIALQNRRGVGHVFSSRHIGEDEAREQFLGYLKGSATGVEIDADQFRLLKFRSGYRQTPWVKNVVAIGMSQGFVEPLEASAIVMVELSAAMLSDTLPPATAQISSTAVRFNSRFTYRWARIVDFLKLHYVLSKRNEPFWRDHRDEVTWPIRLRELLRRWKDMPPSREDFVQSQEIFPAASYAYVLYGMGFSLPDRPYVRRKDLPDRTQKRSSEILGRTQKMLGGLPSNRGLLNQICSHKHTSGLGVG
jgi:hypothetical protein